MEDGVTSALRRAARGLALAALTAGAAPGFAPAQGTPADVSLRYGKLSSKERVLWQHLAARVQMQMHQEPGTGARVPRQQAAREVEGQAVEMHA